MTETTFSQRLAEIRSSAAEQGHRLVPPKNNWPNVEDTSNYITTCDACDAVLSVDPVTGEFRGSLLQVKTCHVGRGPQRG